VIKYRKAPQKKKMKFYCNTNSKFLFTISIRRCGTAIARELNNMLFENVEIHNIGQIKRLEGGEGVLLFRVPELL
jgi:hypothetical protein